MYIFIQNHQEPKLISKSAQYLSRANNKDKSNESEKPT